MAPTSPPKTASRELFHHFTALKMGCFRACREEENPFLDMQDLAQWNRPTWLPAEEITALLEA